ncbi:unnamed protein product [Calypogeia fissa]
MRRPRSLLQGVDTPVLLLASRLCQRSVHLCVAIGAILKMSSSAGGGDLSSAAAVFRELLLQSHPVVSDELLVEYVRPSGAGVVVLDVHFCHMREAFSGYEDLISWRILQR